MKDLSIIIVSYNNKDVIAECLDSIEKHNDIDSRLETILVEQSDSDEIYNWARETYPWVRVLRAENRGFGAGNNRGAESAEGEYLLFLNPDTVLTMPIAGYAVRKFRDNDKLGLFGVKLVARDGSFCSSFEMTIPFGIINKLIHRLCVAIDVFLSRRMYIEGADMFVRKTAFEEAGRFDENIFMYFEEADLCERIRRAGYKIAYFNDKNIIHLQGACSDSKFAKTYARQLESFKYVCGKFGWNFSRIISRDIRIWDVRARLGLNREFSEAVARIEREAIRSGR